MRSQLEWNVLDVEEDEWNRHIMALEVAAAANGFPLAAPPGQTAAAGDGTGVSCHISRPWRANSWPWRRRLAGSAAVLILATAAGYNIWHTAQAGLAQIETDVANVVKLENIKARARLRAEESAAIVESVDLRGNTAMAQVVMTQTSASGRVTEMRQPRFYIQTATGWERTDPLAEFWGPTASLDTTNLHFVFGARDRAAVEQIAPIAELLYKDLMRATGQTLTDGDLLTIEVVPDRYAAGAALVEGRIRVTSPFLFSSSTAMSGKEAFARLLRDAMCTPMLAALRQTAVKPQWQPLLQDGFQCRLLNDAIAAQAPAAAAVFGAAAEANAPGYMELELDALMDWSFRSLSHRDRQLARSSRGAASIYAAGAGYYQTRASAVGATKLIAFVAATYGLDALPRMLQGFRQYDDWEGLAPAVFGVSAAELEAAWHAGAP